MLHTAYLGDQKEIAKELEEIRVAQHWVNQEGWDVASEAHVHSQRTGQVVDLHLDWGAVQKALARRADWGDRVERLFLREAGPYSACLQIVS